MLDEDRKIDNGIQADVAYDLLKQIYQQTGSKLLKK